MEAILYICHGSRVKEARDQAVHFIQASMKQQQEKIQEYCFLELAEPTIEQAYESCVRQGATIIKAVPVLLLTAAHAKQDIPEVLNELKTRFPDIKLKYGRPIGVNEKMVDILEERLKETEQGLEGSLVLLVGRGSSDPDVKRDLKEIAGKLESRLHRSEVKECYLTAADPSFITAIEEATNSSYKKVFVVPYLLFTGILMKSMEKQIDELPKNGKDFFLCRYLGYHPKIHEVLSQRILELSGENAYVSGYA